MIIAPDGTYSYDDLEHATVRVAGALLGGTDDLCEARVAYWSRPSFAHLAMARGIWRAGGIAVPLAISHPPAELQHVIQDSDASVVIADASAAPTLEPIARAYGARFVLTDDLLLSPLAPALPVAPVPARRALIVYTSGTTGRPKGVVSTHGNIQAQISSLLTAWEWTTCDRTLLVLPLHHVHGIINVVGCAVSARATLELLPGFDADAVWDRLASGDITVFTAVPTIYRRLIQSWEAAPADVQRRRSDGCSRARLMMCGSAALPVSVLERWREITGHTLLERYGMTELGMALSNPLHGERRPGHVGQPLPLVETRLVDGELEVRGPNVFLEYWRRPEETAAAFDDGWFRTGDVAAFENGSYRLLGRTSVDIIKTGGYKVSALEIEEVVREHPAVADCAVVGRPDADWGECVCAAIELRTGESLDVHGVQAWTRPRLAPYKIPREIRCVDALPRNAMGKVVKPEVARLFT